MTKKSTAVCVTLAVILYLWVSAVQCVSCTDSYKSECSREPGSKGGHHCGQLIRMSVLQHEVSKLLPAEITHGDSQR